MEAPTDSTSSMGQRLVRCYGNLYAAARVDALDSLDNLPALKDADELKSKILFSVVVVSRPAVTHLFASSGFCFSLFPGWLAYIVISVLCFCPHELLALRNTFSSCHFLYMYTFMSWGIPCDAIMCRPTRNIMIYHTCYRIRGTSCSWTITFVSIQFQSLECVVAHYIAGEVLCVRTVQVQMATMM